MKTRNIKFCAFLKLKGVEPVKLEKLSRGKAIYYYEMTEEQYNQLKLDFNSSDFYTYASALDAIKDLAY